MTNFPLYALMESYRLRLTPLQEYLRDHQRPPGQVEARRKAELREILTAFKEGRCHPLVTAMHTLETVLCAERHPLSHLPRVAQNPQSLSHYLQRKDSSPAAFQEARKAHIEKLVGEHLRGGFHSVPYPLQPKDTKWADEILRRLEVSRIKALDVAEEIALHFFIDRETCDGEKNLVDAFDVVRQDEAFDALVHPHDAHIKGDLLEIVKGYEFLDWIDSNTRDQYLTPRIIELRRANEIVDILDAWKRGRHPLLVLSDILSSVVENLNHPYRDLIQNCQWNLEKEKAARKETPGRRDVTSGSEFYLVSLLREQDSFRRQLRAILHQMKEAVVAYRGPESNPAFAAALEAHIDHLVAEPRAAFAIVAGLAGDIFLPDSIEYARVRSQLEEAGEREKKVREARQPMPGLRTQTEAEMREPLREIFAQRANPSQPPQKLTREIYIEPVGSGMIKPYPADGDDQDWEEDVYGTTTARVTTYAVTLVPLRPDLTEALAVRTRQTLKEIAEVEPAFDIPFDRMSEPYERPCKGEGGRRRYNASASLHVETGDGKVKVYTRLDLDDLWTFYYLMEDVIEPSEQIAAAFNNARYAEARGVLLRWEDIGCAYSNRGHRPEQRMGSLEDENPADYVAATLRDTLALYAIDEIGEEQLLHRLIVLADHTLAGRLVAPHNAFPSYQLLESRSREERTAVATYGDVLKDRVTTLLAVIAGVKEKKGERPLFQALLDQIHRIGDDVREAFRQQVRQQEIARDEAFEKRCRELWGKDTLGDIQRKIAEHLAERDLNTEESLKDEGEEQSEAHDLVCRANLAFRSGDVGAVTDRTWRGTSYVSRSPGSLWVRKDLPAALAPFLSSSPREDVGQTVRALGYNRD